MTFNVETKHYISMTQKGCDEAVTQARSVDQEHSAEEFCAWLDGKLQEAFDAGVTAGGKL